MADRPVLIGMALVGALAAGAVAILLGSRAGAAPSDVLIAVLALLLGSLIVSSASSPNRLTLAIAVVAALPFVFRVGRTVDLAAVISVYIFGSLALAPREFTSSDVRSSLARMTRRLIGYTMYGTTFALVSSAVGGALGDSGWEMLVPFVAGALVWIGVEVLLWSVFAASHFRVSPRYLALSEVRDLNVFVTLISTGALFGLIFEVLGWWSLPVALLPYSFAHVAFKRFQETRSTYRQTIRALAQIPEAAGLNIRGHSDRTAELAVAMAKDMGLSPEEVEDVEFAALMHDIGHITLNDPMVVEQGWSEEDLARWGAEIIAGAPSLDRVAGYVRRQYEPFRNPGERSDPTVPTVARIIKIASAYDADRVGNGASRLEALEHLHQGAAYDYDPEVVDSLRRVLESEQSVTV